MKITVVLFEPDQKEGKPVIMEMLGTPHVGDFLPIETDQPPFQIMARIWVGKGKGKNELTFHAKRMPKKSEIIAPQGPKIIT